MLDRMPDNPIRRLREQLGMSQKELAELAQISPQRVLREEQFVYAEPSPKILKVFKEELAGTDYDDCDTIDDYVIARNRLHQQFIEDLCNSPLYEKHVKYALDYATDYWDEQPKLRSPTQMFRECLFETYGLPKSAIKFTIFTGMHPATLSDIETGKVDWDGANALRNVFHNLEVPDEVITLLGILHDQYFVRRT